MTKDELMTMRRGLGAALADCERGAFPGSREWRAEKEARDAVRDFDRAHPDVIAALRAEPRPSRPGPGVAGLDR